MTLKGFTALELFGWLEEQKDFLLLDVRNEIDYGRFKVEGPYPFEMINIAYMDFMEWEDETVAKVPKGRPIRIVCAKEGSAKYVGEILVNHDFEDVQYLFGGIKSWGNMLSPITIHRDKGYELVQFRRPGKASCSYGVLSGNEMRVFDPAKNIAEYQTVADDRGATITRTFETHRQADYISGSLGLLKATGAEIMAPPLDFEGARFPYTPVKDGDLIPFKTGSTEIRVVHTPGHTPGSTSYLIDGKYMITGDAVFIYSIGRPDLGGKVEEWSKMLFKTVKEKILTLDDAITILPGHYMDWKEANERLIFAQSIGKIKEINADIYGIDDESRFVDYIKKNMRQQPEEYAKIREINAGLLEVDDEQKDVLDLGKNECAASAMKG